MGSDRNTYVGIYLEVPDYNLEIKETIYKNPKTGKKIKTKFCPETGEKAIIENTTRYEKKSASAYIDVEGCEDEFYSSEYISSPKNSSIFLLSGNNKFNTSFDDGFFEINANINELIEEFKVEYSKYLECYTENYGEIKIKYGVVSYYS